jgi:DUF3102 family protein
MDCIRSPEMSIRPQGVFGIAFNSMTARAGFEPLRLLTATASDGGTDQRQPQPFCSRVPQVRITLSNAPVGNEFDFVQSKMKTLSDTKPNPGSVSEANVHDALPDLSHVAATFNKPAEHLPGQVVVRDRLPTGDELQHLSEEQKMQYLGKFEADVHAAQEFFRAAHICIEGLNQTAVHHGVAVGGRFQLVKDYLLKQGEFTPWIKRHFNYSERKAQYFMRLAKAWPNLTENEKVDLNKKTITEVLVILGIRTGKNGPAKNPGKTWHLTEVVVTAIGYLTKMEQRAQLPLEQIEFWTKVNAHADKRIKCLQEAAATKREAEGISPPMTAAK